MLEMRHIALSTPSIEREERNRRVFDGRFDVENVSKERVALVRFTAPSEKVTASGVEMESVEGEGFGAFFEENY